MINNHLSGNMLIYANIIIIIIDKLLCVHFINAQTYKLVYIML